MRRPLLTLLLAMMPAALGAQESGATGQVLAL